MTPAQLVQIAPVPKSRIETFLPHLNVFMAQYEIDTPQRQAAFLAQILHESGSFKYTRELATGDAYEGREDLGNLFKGDGRKFKGRGLIQITGRTNYRAVGKALKQDFEKNPDLLQTPKFAVESACWFWKSRSLSLVADKPDAWRITIRKGTPIEKIIDKFGYITYRINGGFNGYAERLKYYKSALQVLTSHHVASDH